MTTPSSSAAYDWMREVKPELKELDQIPLTGSPPFPWDQLSKKLSESFERENIIITPGEMNWRSKEQLLESMGDHPTPLNFSIPSLSGSICWIMPEQEMVSLESLLLTKEAHPITFHDRVLSEAFYRFLALEVLYNLSQIKFDKTLTPILSSKGALPEEDSLCWDLSITIDTQTLWGRLILSPEFRRSWVEHFTKKTHTSSFAMEMASRLDVSMHIEIGKTELTYVEWSEVKVGDWIRLDQFSLNSDLQTGPLSITVQGVHGTKKIKGELEEGKIRINEMPS